MADINMMKLKEMIALFEEEGYKFDGYSKLSQQYCFRIPPEFEPGTVINGNYVYYSLKNLRFFAKNKVTMRQRIPKE